jgi:hypothetical protein
LLGSSRHKPSPKDSTPVAVGLKCDLIAIGRKGGIRVDGARLAGQIDGGFAIDDLPLLGFQFQIYCLHKPGGLDSENASLEFVILHPRHFRIPPTGGAGPLRSRNALIYFH